jgi:hypothetical protein
MRESALWPYLHMADGSAAALSVAICFRITAEHNAPGNSASPFHCADGSTHRLSPSRLTIGCGILTPQYAGPSALAPCRPALPFDFQCLTVWRVSTKPIVMREGTTSPVARGIPDNVCLQAGKYPSRCCPECSYPRLVGWPAPVFFPVPYSLCLVRRRLVSEGGDSSTIRQVISPCEVSSRSIRRYTSADEVVRRHFMIASVDHRQVGFITDP